ncbi:hypothetical protein EVJ58_g6624 [Rhodofomes roseus]|uniref:Uncharacterized protein n=1 Tax=Rhodofomes roseus TaxID=34475 RepID=A0A4Y9Y6X1_9APHY|nr:hypothetical protein EVJ58_g6624 [Rhodofomes roseus]
MQSRASPQSPTCLNVRVKTTEEAHLVLHKVALNHLPMIHNRLLEDERWSVREGSVFVWEERKERDNHNSLSDITPLVPRLLVCDKSLDRWKKMGALPGEGHVPDNMDPAEREELYVLSSDHHVLLTYNASSPSSSVADTYIDAALLRG